MGEKPPKEATGEKQRPSGLASSWSSIDDEWEALAQDIEPAEAVDPHAEDESGFHEEPTRTSTPLEQMEAIARSKNVDEAMERQYLSQGWSEQEAEQTPASLSRGDAWSAVEGEKTPVSQAGVEAWQEAAQPGSDDTDNAAVGEATGGVAPQAAATAAAAEAEASVDQGRPEPHDGESDSSAAAELSPAKKRTRTRKKGRRRTSAAMPVIIPDQRRPRKTQPVPTPARAEDQSPRAAPVTKTRPWLGPAIFVVIALAIFALVLIASHARSP